MRRCYQEVPGAQRTAVTCHVLALWPRTSHSCSLPQFPLLGMRNSHSSCQGCPEGRMICVRNSFVRVYWCDGEGGCHPELFSLGEYFVWRLMQNGLFDQLADVPFLPGNVSLEGPSI